MPKLNLTTDNGTVQLDFDGKNMRIHTTYTMFGEVYWKEVASFSIYEVQKIINKSIWEDAERRKDARKNTSHRG